MKGNLLKGIAWEICGNVVCAAPRFTDNALQEMKPLIIDRSKTSLWLAGAKMQFKRILKVLSKDGRGVAVYEMDVIPNRFGQVLGGLKRETVKRVASFAKYDQGWRVGKAAMDYQKAIGVC